MTNFGEPRDRREPGDASPPRIESPEIIDPDRLWSLVKNGTHNFLSSTDSRYRDGSVVIGPDLGNLSGHPRLLIVGDSLKIKMDISKYGGRGFYDPVPEAILAQNIAAVDPTLSVDGINIYSGEGENKKLIAFSRGEEGFIYQHKGALENVDDFTRQLDYAGRIFLGYASAYYQHNNIPMPHDRVIFSPEDLLREETIVTSRRKLESRREEDNNGMEGVVIIEKPEVRFEDIGGQDKAVQTCRRFARQLLFPEIFALEGSDPPRGILLYGPSGTGKTLIAKAMSHEADTHFLNVTAADIAGEGLFGQTEKAVEAVFSKAEELSAQDGRHVIIFVDEADLLLPGKATPGSSERHEATGKVVGLFAQKIDGFKTSSDSRKITVILATNDPKDLDPRILSRMDETEEVPLPDEKGLAQILQIHLGKLAKRSHNLNLESIDMTSLANKAFEQNLSGRDIADVVSLVARIRGEKQLKILLDAIHSGKITVPPEMSEAAFIKEISTSLSDSKDTDGSLRIPALSTEELVEVIANAKDLLKIKKKRALEFNTL